jgi:UDP-N-acetylmuramoyl-tripeptide--D-alanyl-D-alanine ligase
VTPLWTAAEAAAATGGAATGRWAASGVSIDTRTLRRGDLFVALTAARDGHDFVAEALARGAAAAMVAYRPEDVAEDAPLLVVPDVLDGLWALGRAGRARSDARVIAVTGSAGKTSTKDMLRAMLGGPPRVHAAEASYNNHWGVPLTLARLDPEATFAVVEIGMNAPGEIAPLARLARPHVALVTTIGRAHLERLGSIEAIAREKASIAHGLLGGGTMIIPGDLPQTPILASAAARAGARTITFGEGRHDHHRILDVILAADSTVVQARAWRTPVLFKIGGAGRHVASNALGALAAVGAAGGDRAEAICALAAWRPPRGRGARQTVCLDPADEAATVELIDDAFNANPDSMAVALEALAATAPRPGVGRAARGRRIAVLGDMLELGTEEIALHAALAAHPAMAGIARVHCVGPRMRALWRALPEDRRGSWTQDAEAMARGVRGHLAAGDVVLVKGSKGSRVSLVVDAIRKLGHPHAGDTTGPP